MSNNTLPTRISEVPWPEQAGWAAIGHGDYIYGYGASEAHAWNMVVEYYDENMQHGFDDIEPDEADFRILPVSAGVLAEAEHDSDIPLEEGENGVYCTKKELADREQQIADLKAEWDEWIENQAWAPLDGGLQAPVVSGEDGSALAFLSEAMEEERLDKLDIRRMLAEMAWAYAEGDDRIHISASGRPMLAATGKREARHLPVRRWHAAKALAEIGIDGFADAWIYYPVARLEQYGQLIYGPEWVSPMARDLSVALRTVQRWKAEERPIPDYVFEKLRPGLEQAEKKAQSHISTIRRLLAA